MGGTGMVFGVFVLWAAFGSGAHPSFGGLSCVSVVFGLCLFGVLCRLVQNAPVFLTYFVHVVYGVQHVQCFCVLRVYTTSTAV